MPKHVLVVDDLRDSADAFAQVIAMATHGELTTEALYGGQACLDRLTREPKVDLILLDIDMPVVSGADVIRAVLQMHPLPDLKIIPMTAWGYDWPDRWHLRHLKDTPEYQRVVHEGYDKGTTGVEPLVELLQKAATGG